MKHAWLYTIGLLLLGMVTFHTSPAKAATAAGPYYATPSWDQQLQCDATATCPRFIVLSNWGNAAVLDRETGLVWEQSPSSVTLNWQIAQLVCNNLNKGNRKGWRLPTVQELASLIDPTQANPALPSGHPFTNVQSFPYWSATTFDIDTTDAFFVTFLNGLGSTIEKTDTTVFAWCVRGGQGVDPQ